MRLDVKAFALTCAVVCGLGVPLLTWWVIAFEGARSRSDLDWAHLPRLQPDPRREPHRRRVGVLRRPDRWSAVRLAVRLLRHAWRGRSPYGCLTRAARQNPIGDTADAGFTQHSAPPRKGAASGAASAGRLPDASQRAFRTVCDEELCRATGRSLPHRVSGADQRPRPPPAQAGA